jgi:hypothetical protein
MHVLTVTDDDRTLAAELGLFLVRQPETDADRADAQRPGATRVPEGWIVRSVLTGKPVGHLRLTEVDCLYVSKYAAGTRGIEETIVDALRWIAPLTRHVRTGAYEGTEVIVRRFGSTYERPRALTECGARSTGADYSPVAAQSELVNGRSHEMCPACRAKLEERGTRDLSHLPGRSGSSTARQQAYIRHLLDEGARCGRPYLMEARTINQMSRREASEAIDRLRALKERGWRGDL